MCPLTGQLTELLTHSYPDTRHGSLCGCLKLMSIDLCVDQYLEYSTRSETGSSKAAATRVHQMTITPLPARDAAFRNLANKAQLDSLIREQILIDAQYLQQVTQHHRVVDNSITASNKLLLAIMLFQPRYQRGAKYLVWIMSQPKKKQT